MDCFFYQNLKLHLRIKWQLGLKETKKEWLG